RRGGRPVRGVGGSRGGGRRRPPARPRLPPGPRLEHSGPHAVDADPGNAAQPDPWQEPRRLRQEAGVNRSSGPLSARDISDTVSWIASVQLPNGMIPWFPGGHADPWNHTESAMALVAAGRRREAERAFGWLAATQLPDGTWCRYHLAEGIEDPRRDPNVGIYVAAGAWWHYLCTDDLGLLEEMWPVIERAVGFALRLQQPGGEVLWSMDPDGHLGRYALLTSTSSILHS